MLKELLVVSLIGLTSSFVYGEENNDDYILINEWKCKVTLGVKKVYGYVDDKEQQPDFFDLKGEIYFINSYKKGNDLKLLSVYNNYFIPMPLKIDNYSKFDVTVTCKKNERFSTMSQIEHIFISNDKFKEISNTAKNGVILIDILINFILKLYAPK